MTTASRRRAAPPPRPCRGPAAAGARAALLQYNNSAADLSAAFRQLSGLVVPGGHCGFHTTQYGSVSADLLAMAEAAGDFPVWGTCQGFQQLAQYGATGKGMHPSILHRTGNDTDGVALPLNFTAEARTSRMLRDVRPPGAPQRWGALTCAVRHLMKIKCFLLSKFKESTGRDPLR